MPPARPRPHKIAAQTKREAENARRAATDQRGRARTDPRAQVGLRVPAVLRVAVRPVDRVLRGLRVLRVLRGARVLERLPEVQGGSDPVALCNPGPGFRLNLFWVALHCGRRTPEGFFVWAVR